MTRKKKKKKSGEGLTRALSSSRSQGSLTRLERAICRPRSITGHTWEAHHIGLLTWTKIVQDFGEKHHRGWLARVDIGSHATHVYIKKYSQFDGWNGYSPARIFT